MLALIQPEPGSNLTRDFLLGQGLHPVASVLAAVALSAIIILVISAVVALLGTWLERKVSGHIQCRFGPMRVGPHGAFQPVADAVKLLIKEDLIPTGADKVLFVLAPALVMASVLGALAVFPLSPDFYFANIHMGVFAILALTSTTTIGVVMSGWASNSKWSLYGAMREAAQVVAYEIPLGLSMLVPLLVAGTFNLLQVSADQAGGLGVFNWYIWPWINPFMIPAFVLFFVAILAETKRAPFDLPETESELVAGFMTEYSGLRWSFFFMEEYAAMFLYSVVGAFFFFGGFETPLTWLVRDVALGGDAAAMTGGWSLLYNLAALVGIVAKGFAGILLMMWVRWTLPRLRIDQVMTLGYKYLTPLSLLCVLGAVLWEMIPLPWRS